MFYKEKSTRDDTQKATFLNEFFISVYQKESNPNPLARNTNRSPTEESCSQTHIEETRIEFILKNLLTNKASGFDGIGNIILKYLSETLSKSLFFSAHSLTSGFSRPTGKQVKWPQFLKKRTRRQLSATAQLAFYAPTRRSPKKLSLIINTPKFNLSWKTHKTASGKKDQQYHKWYNF